MLQLIPIFLAEFTANIFASGIAPHNSTMVGLSCLVPSHNCLSLVCDSHTFDILHAKLFIRFTDFLDSLPDGLMHIFDDFLRIMLEPALLRSELFVLDDALAE